MLLHLAKLRNNMLVPRFRVVKVKIELEDIEKEADALEKLTDKELKKIGRAKTTELKERLKLARHELDELRKIRDSKTKKA